MENTVNNTINENSEVIEVKAEVKAEESKFFLVKTFENLVKDWEKALQDYKTKYVEKYVTKRIETGKEFVKGVEKDSKKLLNDVLDNSKKTLENYKEKYFDRAKTNFNEALEDFTEVSKKLKEKFPIVNNLNLDNIEEKVSDKLSRIGAFLNLPSKDDIEKLVAAMDNLDTKVNDIGKRLTVAIQ